MKVKIINTNSISSDKSRKYWSKYVGKIYKVVAISEDAAGRKLYKLDMSRDEGGIRNWFEDEVKICQL